MDVVVCVIAPVAVIALVNGNDIVDLIDAVNDSAQPLVARGSNKTGGKRATTASATITASFPFASAATITASFPFTSAATITVPITPTIT